MISLLSRFFIKDRENVSDPAVRSAYGTLCGVVGIVLNIILFAFKYLAGVLSGSIAIMADSFNNLSDAGSSLITLLGFRLAEKKPDPNHPFGHGRLEYISGLVVSALIILMGVELAKSSVGKILDPGELSAGLLPALILAVSICVKVYMCLYNRSIGRKIDSSAMIATGMDSLSDSIATAVVLLSMGISHFTGVNIDGYAGALVSLFIIWAGINAARDTLSPLLGQAPDADYVRSISDLVMSYPEAKGIHDLIVHDYGPGRKMISLHVEVDGSGDVFELHDAIDNMEMDLKRRFGCLATIHMDPINTNDEEVSLSRAAVAELVKGIDPAITIHDFRMVSGSSHTNLIFDAVVPYGCPLSDREAEETIKAMVEKAMPGHFAVVTIDRAYV